MILYAENPDNHDYVFIVKWHETSENRTHRLIFDCYEDKWKEYNSEEYYIPANRVKHEIDPMDLKMAGGYIDHYDDLKFPENIKNDFLKLVFEKDIKKR